HASAKAIKRLLTPLPLFHLGVDRLLRLMPNSHLHNNVMYRTYYKPLVHRQRVHSLARHKTLAVSAVTLLVLVSLRFTALLKLAATSSANNSKHRPPLLHAVKKSVAVYLVSFSNTVCLH